MSCYPPRAAVAEVLREYAEIDAMASGRNWVRG